MLLPRSSGPGAVQGDIEPSLLFTRRNETDTKDDPSGGMSSGAKISVIVIALIVIVAVIFAILFLYARSLRSRNASPKYIPTQALKDRWRRWTSTRGRYSDRLQPSDSSPPSLRPIATRGTRSSSPALEELRTRESSAQPAAGASVDAETGNSSGGGGGARDSTAVDRHTSVRSIMTLPAYTPSARDSEQILGREGERGGIDVVLEFPETAGEVEDRREAEMEGLFQIRQRRRAEAAEREERRRRRREARERGDRAELERLRVEAREAQEREERQLLGEGHAGQPTSARLIAEHQEETQRRERQRRVSSVQYAELGVARHDGSRVRAGSNASQRSEDSRPLLDSAASMGGSSRRETLSTLGAMSGHHRNRSASSVLSMSSVGTDEEDGGSIYHPPFAPPLELSEHHMAERGRSDTQASSPDFEVVSLHSTAGRGRSLTPRPHSSSTGSATRPDVPSISVNAAAAASTRSLTENGTLETPVDNPPHYEHLAANEFGEPPVYSSPVSKRAPQLPPINHVPSIRVSETASPLRSPGWPGSTIEGDSNEH